MLQIKKHQALRKYERGVIPLVVVLALTIASATVIGGGYFLNLAKEKGFFSPTLSNLVENIETQSSYLDKERVENSFFDDTVVGTVVLPSGSFSAYRIVNGEIEGSGKRFTSKARISFLSGDQFLDSFDDGAITSFYLKDGTRTVAQIMDRMVANLVLDNSTSYAIKILQGKVEEGRLIGNFVGQTYDSGFVIAGTVDRYGKITNVIVKTGAQKTTEVESTVAKNAVSLFRSISDLSADIDVLGISDYQPTGFNKPIFDESTGTWVFAGETSGGTILASPIQGVVNYIQSVAQSISSGDSVYKQLTGGTIQGITDIESESSELTINTVDNIATLSLDLSGITASLSDGAVTVSKLSSANSASNGNCLTYDSSVSQFKWGSCGGGGSGTIAGVTAGNGLTGGGTSGSVSLSLDVQSGGGLISTASGVSLLRACGDGEVLKWTDATSSWDCAVDAGGAGGGISTLQTDDVTVVSSATVLDFLGSDFDLTNSPTGEGNLSIDYTSSKITRSDQSQSITGAWIFSAAPAIATITNTGTLTLPTSTDTLIGRSTTDTLTNKTIAAGGNTISGLSVTNFTSANISQWTNNSGYITGNQAITLSGDLSGSGTTSINATIGAGAVTLSKMANLAANSIIGNNAGSSAVPVALTSSQVKTLLGISTSDISGLGTIATQSASNVYITGGQLTGLATINGATISGGSLSGTAVNGVTTGNIVLSTGSYSDPTWVTSLSPTKVLPDQTGNNGKVLGTNGTTLSWVTNSSGVAWGAITGTLSSQSDLNTALSGKLGTSLTSANIFVGNGSGVATGVSVSGDISINNTGATTIGTGVVTLGKMANLAANSIIGNNTGSSGTPIALTASQVKTLLSISTGDVSGLGTIATQSASNIFVTGGQISGGTIGGTASGLTMSGATNTLSNIGNSSLTNSSVTINSSGILSGGGSLSLGGTLNLSATEADTLSSVTGRGASTATALTLSNALPITFSGTTPTLTFSGGDTILDLTGGVTRTLSVLNSTVGQVAGLSVEGTITGSNFSGTSSGTNTGDQTITLTSDITGSGTGSFATTIASGVVSLSKMANLAANSIIGNNTGSVATPIALTGAQVKTLLNISTADISNIGTIATQSASNVFITGGQLSGLTLINGATISGGTLSGGSLSSTAVNGVTTGDIALTTGSYANPSWITSLSPTKVLPDQTGNNGKVLGTNGSTLSWITNSSGVAWGAITGLLNDQTDLTASLSAKLSRTLTSANIFVGNGSNIATGVAVTGDVSIDNTGLTTIGNGIVTLSKMANLAANSIIGNNTGSPTTPIALTAAQVKTLLGISTSDISGLGTIATQSASNVFITGGQVTGGTITGVTIGGTASGLSISGSSNTLSNIGNSSLTNSSVTINSSGILSGGGSLSLGGTLNLSAVEADTLSAVTGRGASTATALTLSNASPITFSGTTPTLTFSGGDTILDLTGGVTRTLSVLNSTVGQVANLSVEGTLSGSNFSGTSSGTNTGDQTITLTGDVTGSGTGSFATTISANSVALTTDTTGNYVASITNGSGISGGDSGSEGVGITLALGALTADWNQTGAFDITLNNSSSELKMLESGITPSLFGILDVGDLSATDSTFTFSGGSGTVLTSANAASSLSGWDQNSSDDLTTGNYTTTLDSVYVNVGESPAAGDISGSFTAGLTIGADSVALTSDTTGNYVASANTSALTGLTGGSGGSEGAALTLGFDYSQALSGDVGLAANAAVFGQSGLVFEGSVADINETFFVVTNPTADRTITFPNATITVNAAADLSGTTLASGVTASSLTSVGTLSSLTATGAVNINTTGTSNTSIGNGTGTISLTLGSDATGDLLYRGAGGNLTRLADVAAGSCLVSGGVGAAPAWGSCGAGGGSLDTAYNSGGTVTVDAYDVLLNLSNATNDYKFTIDNATTGDIATAFAITSTGVGGTTGTAIDLSDADIATAIALGANDVTVGGVIITSAEFAYLDGHDAPLVDTNDAVSTAITGVGTLGSLAVTGAITGATVTNTINGLIINSGALSGITTISASGQITSTVTTGTAPFVVASATNVANLNASSLNGATFAAPGSIGSTTPGSGAFTTLSATGAITGATATNTINGLVINSGALSNATTLGLSGAITGATATNTINGMIINAGAVSGVTTLGASSTVTIGSGGNTFTFNPASGPVYAGTAMPTKRITLTPEYAGATLTGDGTSNTGTMTSDTETASPFKSYYNWSSAQGTAQDYDVWIKVPIPSDFSAMASTDSLTVEARSDNLANTAITIVQVYDTANAADCTTGNINIEPGTVNTWADTTPTDTCTGGTYAADGIMTIQLRLSSLSNANARVGRLYLQYKAKF